MNITGKYSITCNIYTMFNTYTIQVENHNLITKEGYDFFLKKWYIENDKYPIVLGYYNDNKFYKKLSVDDEYSEEIEEYDGATNYIDRQTYKQYRYIDGNFVSFTELLDKICIGNCNYLNTPNPSEDDIDLYNLTHEYEIETVKFENKKIIMRYSMENNELNNSTEIGVKTNHGRLVSHDIHAPYNNLPTGTNIILEYVFEL